MLTLCTLSKKTSQMIENIVSESKGVPTIVLSFPSFLSFLSFPSFHSSLYF